MAVLKKTQTEVQNAFFEKLKVGLPSNVSIVNEISDLLEISADGAYRRLRGETELTMTEFLKLCAHFKYSPEIFAANESSLVSFNYSVLSKNEQNFERFFGSILSDLEQFSKMKDLQLIFTAEDIPIFHYFNYPNLTAFKLFYWNKAVLNVSALENKKFDAELISPELKKTAKRIFETYLSINSSEIWSDDTIVSVLKQIEFYWDSGNFKSPEDALIVCDELLEMLNYLEKAAGLSSKFSSPEKYALNEGNFSFYQSDIMIGNNVILIKSPSFNKVYLSYNTLNTMSTSNKGFCDEIENWIKNLTRKSSLVSGTAEKQRFQFFNRMYLKLKLLRDKISN